MHTAVCLLANTVHGLHSVSSMVLKNWSWLRIQIETFRQAHFKGTSRYKRRLPPQRYNCRWCAKAIFAWVIHINHGPIFAEICWWQPLHHRGIKQMGKICNMIFPAIKNEKLLLLKALENSVKMHINHLSPELFWVQQNWLFAGQMTT